MMELFEYQQTALARVADKTKCAFYHDMGLGKTFIGAEKLIRDSRWSIAIVVCQKSKVCDWVDHFERNYTGVSVIDLTAKNASANDFADRLGRVVAVINYDLIWRRDELFGLDDIAVMFDESSLLQNPSSKRTKAAMRLAENASPVILLSGTPVDGKYERLWTQLHMLGWNITEHLFWQQYVETKTTMQEGFPIKTVVGYKNEQRLANKMKSLGCDFLKTEDVLNLPQQRFIDVPCNRTDEYATFTNKRYAVCDGEEFVGDTVFAAMTAERLLAGAHSAEKLKAFADIVASTSDRLVVFFNFNSELDAMMKILDGQGKPVSVLNGRERDLSAFKENDDGVALIQYQAGAMGVNLQDAHYAVYFSPPLASSLFEQSKKRIHRVGQNKPCTYYLLVSKGTIEEKIYKTLKMRKDYTERLFTLGSKNGG